MGHPTEFTTLLRALMAQALRTNKDLARLTGLSIYTIENWTGGKVQRPRFAADVLKIARVLALDAQTTTTLLATAGHPPLATLHTQAQQTGDRHLVALLAPWAHADTAILAGAAPAPMPIAAPRHQLRPPVADFVGRTHETAQLIQALRSAVAQRRGALISGMHGMGGIGKTELAYAVADQIRDTFPDAQLVLNLRGSSADPLPIEQALRTVIHALSPELRLPEELEALEQHYRTALHKRRVLILADDARDATQVRPLVPAIGSALLITSRVRFTLPGMVSADLEQFSAEEAITLLRNICVRLTRAEAQAIAQTCGYLPLALRVSASILHNDPALSVAAYLARLADERLRLVQLRDSDDARLDVEASLRLSYARLDGAAQEVFRRLGVLVADFTTELALAVVATEKGEALLHRLLRCNLLMYDTALMRWRLHDLVRDVARHELEATDGWEPTMWRYAQAAVQLAQEVEAQYVRGGDCMLAALARFDAERPHIDAARMWATAHMGTAAGDALLVADARATDVMGYLRYDRQRELIPNLERALDAARHLSDQPGEVSILNRLGIVYEDLGEAGRVIEYSNHHLAIAQIIGDRRGEGQAFHRLGAAYVALGDAQRAIVNLESALAIYRALGSRSGEAAVLDNLGLAYLNLGDASRAVQAFEQECAIAGELGNRHIEGIALHHLGEASVSLGLAQQAITYCIRARDFLREIGDRREEGYTLHVFGVAYASLGDHVRATEAFEQALTMLQDVGDRWGEAMCRWSFGLALMNQRKREEALSLLHDAVAYEVEIQHAKAVEHMALLARLEAGGADAKGLLI